MIIEYYKGYLGIEKIRELLKINQNGTTAFHIVEGAKKIGFEAKGIKCSLDDINQDNIILPCIANVIINNTYKHFIVIYKINFEKKTIMLADPSNKIINMSFDIFKSIFSGIIIILYPKEDIPYEKIPNLRRNLLIHIVKSHPKLIKQIIILSSFITIFSIITSFFLEQLSNTIEHYGTKEILILVVILFLVVTFLKNLTNYFRNKVLIIINEKINLELTIDTFKKILLLPYKNYRSKSTGDIVTRLVDVNVVKNSLSKIFVTVIVDLPLAVCSMFILILINIKLFFLSLVILILYIIIILIFKDYFDDKSKEIKNHNVNTTHYMIECINNFETIKGLNIYDSINQQFEKRFVKLLNTSYSYENKLHIQKLFKDVISDCGLLILFGIGSIFVIDSQLTFASLLTFSSLINYFFDPVKNLVNLESDMREFKIVVNRLFELNNSIKENGITNSLYNGSIIIKNLNYTYDDKKDVLKDVNLEIKAGEKVIIFGTSGSGKSTLVKILLKYYEVNRDNIFINNIDINDYSDVNGIKYICQSENLFTDSLYNNITLYRQVNINKILEIAEMCCVNEIIKDNNRGFNMFIEDNGFNLSGGEKQRIILARTLLEKFNILIIDEGLNQVDINMERIILKRMFEKYNNKTIIVISHRNENLDLYDRKIILEEGKIIENIRKI